MRKQLFLQLAFLLFTFCIVKAQTLLYDFSFNNTLSATVGTGTFTSTGVTFVTDRFGNPNSAINLNSTGTTTTLTGLPLGSAARTISLWVKMNTFNANFNFLYNYGTSANPEGAFIIQNQATHFAPSHARATTHNNTTQWVHYVFTYDGTASRIYVNGTLLGTTNLSKNTVNNGNLFRLGLTENGGTNFFNGAIDGLKIYDGAVSDQFVQQLYLECSSTSPVPVNTTPSTNLSICTGSTTTLTVQSDSLVNWFDAPTGGTSIGTGNTFNTPALTATTTFYAEAGTVCKSSRLPFIVNVSSSASPSTPQILSDTSILYCEGSQATLSVQSNATVRWYDAPTGGNLLATGSTYQTPSLVNNAGAGQTDVQNVYAESFNSCANPTTSPRVAVRIKVGTGNFTVTNTTPAENYFACTGSATTFTLTTNASTVQWLLNDVVKGTGNSYTTAPLSSDSTYVARVFSAGSCTTLVAFPVKVYAKEVAGPTNLTNTTNTFCPGDSVTLKASSATGAPLEWFVLDNTGTFLIKIGFNVDSIRVAIPQGGQFRVRSGSTNGCYSAQTTIQFNVTPTPVGTITLSGTTISSTNLFDSYVLLRNGTQVAQSTTTGTFTFNNATCGDYQALFTNTVNSCPATIFIDMRRQNVSTGCDNIVISSPSGITFPATVQARKGGGTFTAPIALNQTGNTTLNNICTVVGGTNNLEVRIVGANGCVFLFNRNTNNVTTSTTPTLQIADYLEGDLLTTCTIRSNIVTVSIAAPTSTTSAANLSRCLGQTTTLTANGTGTLNWYNVSTGGTVLGTGTSFTTPPITATTVFYVEATSGNCISARTAIVVTLNPTPTASITPPSATICAGEEVTLIASGGAATWSVPSGGFQGITVSPISTTTYSVTVTQGGCSATTSATVTVNQPSATSLAQTICFGETFTFKGQAIAQSGVYRDTLTNAAGCDSIITLNLTVRNENVTNINAQICVGQTYEFDGQQLDLEDTYTAVFTAASGCDSTVTLNLSVVTEITETVNASICQGDSYTFNGQQLTIEDTYTATFLSIGGCDSIVTLNLIVNPLPQPSVTANNANVSTEAFATYQWQLNGNDIQGADQQNYTATQNGDYSVVVTDANGCENTSDAVNVTIVSVANYELGFKVYPNPTSGLVNIETLINNAEINIITLEGKVLFSQKATNNTTVVDLTSLAHGMYIIEMKAENAISRVRVVKE